MDSPPRAETPKRPAASPRGKTPQRPPIDRATTPTREGSPRAGFQKRTGGLFRCGAPQQEAQAVRREPVPREEPVLSEEEEVVETPEWKAVREQAGLAMPLTWMSPTPMSPTPAEHQEALSQLAAQHDLRAYTQLSGLHKKMDAVMTAVSHKGGGSGRQPVREAQSTEREHARSLERVRAGRCLLLPCLVPHRANTTHATLHVCCCVQVHTEHRRAMGSMQKQYEQEIRSLTTAHGREVSSLLSAQTQQARDYERALARLNAQNEQRIRELQREAERQAASHQRQLAEMLSQRQLAEKAHAAALADSAREIQTLRNSSRNSSGAS